jgi:ATP-dependent helicase HrpB
VTSRLTRSGLPIDEALEPLRAALASGRNAVLVAPPGAGKSTVVPLALLEEPWARGRRIVMLEPRRLATRAVASRMAATLGESAGQTVGYRMRLETRVGKRTRIEVVTEGVFTRMLQEDPALGGVAAVLFDEFHERNLHADLGLALALDAQRHVAPELRLLAMSATLDGARVAELLGGAPVISAEGRLFPVELHHLGKGLPALPGGPEPIEAAAARAAQRALREAPGDLLMFLPGAGEIRRVQARFAEAELGADVDVLPLYGELPPDAQDAALAPARAGRRKAILATNIAETSLTIDGVRIVVDVGLERRSVFDPASGMSRLETQRISRASAEQRAGRAGRTAPGACYRLWGESAERTLAAFAPAEIASADLAPLALDLAVWGTDAADLRWLDAPPAATLASACDLLRRLGALDAAGRATAHGRAMHELGAHPRLAHMLLAARARGAAPAAAELAALLSERDLLRGRAAAARGERDSDLRSRLEVLRREPGAAHAVDRGALERVRRAERAFRRQIRAGDERAQDSPLEPGLLLAFAYPDRIAKRRAGGDGRYQLATGRGASFAGPESIARAEFIVAVDVDDRERDARILLAAPLDRDDLLAHFADQIVRADEVAWDARAEAVVARRTVRFGELLLEEKPLQDVPAEASAAAFVEGLRSLGLEALPWGDASRDFAARSEFVRALGRGDVVDWPDLSDAALARDLGWLEPFRRGPHAALAARTHAAHRRAALAAHAEAAEAARRARADARDAADRHTRARIDYRDDNAPCASMRMQEGVRARRDAADRRRRRARHVQAVVARAAATPGHARSRELLAQRVRRGPQGHARALSEALLARRIRCRPSRRGARSRGRRAVDPESAAFVESAGGADCERAAREPGLRVRLSSGVAPSHSVEARKHPQDGSPQAGSPACSPGSGPRGGLRTREMWRLCGPRAAHRRPSQQREPRHRGNDRCQQNADFGAADEALAEGKVCNEQGHRKANPGEQAATSQ